MTMAILGFIYWIANCIMMGVGAKLIGDIDGREDIKVYHILLAILFIPATVILFIVGCVGVGCMELSYWWQLKKPMKFLYKPVFKKKD